MSIWLQLLIFGVTGFLIYLGVYFIVPKRIKRGKSSLVSFFGSLWLPVFLLTPLALLLYGTLEGGSLTLEQISTRFRFTAITGADWFWVIGGIVVTVVADQLLEPMGKKFAKVKALAPPDYLPAPFNPLDPLTLPLKRFFDVDLAGNWKLLLIFIPLHLVAMVSEEVMWRGFLLPIQENMFGGFAWVINGLLWAWLVHAILKWHFIGMLPGMLAAPLVAQMTQSTWSAVIVHVLPNAILWIILIWGVLNKPPKSSQDPNLSTSL